MCSQCAGWPPPSWSVECTRPIAPSVQPSLSRMSPPRMRTTPPPTRRPRCHCPTHSCATGWRGRHLRGLWEVLWRASETSRRVAPARRPQRSAACPPRAARLTGCTVGRPSGARAAAVGSVRGHGNPASERPEPETPFGPEITTCLETTHVHVAVRQPKPPAAACHAALPLPLVVRAVHVARCAATVLRRTGNKPDGSEKFAGGQTEPRYRARGRRSAGRTCRPSRHCPVYCPCSVRTVGAGRGAARALSTASASACRHSSRLHRSTSPRQ